MRTINSVATSNTYTDAATLQNVIGSAGGYATIQGADVFASIQYAPPSSAAYGFSHGFTQWTDDFHVPAGTLDIAKGTLGIRFRSYVAGSPATVSAAIAEGDEPLIAIAAGGQLASTITNALPVFNIMDPAYGAKGGGNDDTTAIQAAINDIGTAGGGILFVPLDVFGVSQPLTIPNVPLMIRGLGASYILDDIHYPTPPVGSTLRWIGASGGTMIEAIRVALVFFEDINLDMNHLATTGIYCETFFMGGSRGQVSIINGQRNGVAGGTLNSTGLFIAGNNVNGSISPHNHWGPLYIDAATQLELTALNGTANDVTLSIFEHISGRFGDPTNNSPALFFDNSDAIVVHFAYAFGAYGTGPTAHFGAHARKVYMGYLHAGGPSNTGPTVDAPAVAGQKIDIAHLDRGDGGNLPTGAGIAAGVLSFNDLSNGTNAGVSLASRIARPVITVAESGGGSYTPNMRSASDWIFTYADNIAFAINNPLAETDLTSLDATQEVTFELRNNSGGALTTATFGPNYTFTGGAVAWPAAGKKKLYRFYWNGAEMVELFRTPDYT